MKRLAFLHRILLGKVSLSLFGVAFLLYLLLFTPWGNRLMTPLVEKSLSSALSEPITVREFALHHNRFHLMVQDEFGNTISTQGGFSLLTLRLYAHYRLECFQAGGFNPIGAPFKTDGALNGGIAAFIVQGNADIFEGNILYQIELHRFHLAILDLKLHNITYEPLLSLLDYPSDTDTTLSGDIALRGFDRRDIEGNIRLQSQTHRLTPTPIIEDTNESFDFKSLLADEYGRVRPFDVNITVDAALANIGILEQFVGMPLRGSSKLNATLIGDARLLHFKAHSDIADSDMSLRVKIVDLEPQSLSFDLRHADIEKTFSFLTLPSPLSGKADAHGDLSSAGGKFDFTVTQGKTLPEVLRQEYNITQPLIHFDASVHADVTQKGVHYRGSFKSDLNRMEIDNTTTHDQMLSELLKTLR